MIVDYSYKYVPTIRLMRDDEAFIRLLIGPFGSGKSAGMTMQLLRQALHQKPGPDGVRRTRFAIVRNTWPELRDTTQVTFFEWIKKGVMGTYRVADKTFVLDQLSWEGHPVYSEFIFRGLDTPDDERDLLSLELTGCWFNELKEISKRIFDMMQFRVGRYPPVKEGGCSWAGILGDSNPPDTDHWLYKILEGSGVAPESHILHIFYPEGHQKAGQKFLSKFHQASGLAVHPDGIWGIPVPGIHAENLPYLSEGYYADKIIGKEQDFIDVYIHGKFGYVRDGKPVYANWNPMVHIAKGGPIEIVKSYPLLIGWDFGYDYSAAILCQLLPNGQFNIKREFLEEDMGLRAFARDVVKPHLFANYIGMDWIGTGDLAGKGHSPIDGSTCFSELLDLGLPAEPAMSNAWQPRFDAVDGYLTKRVEGDKPALQVDPLCKMVIKGFNGEYKYKRLYDARKERFGDKPFKNEYSHLHDGIQYAAMFTEVGLKEYRRRRTSTSSPGKPLPSGAWT